MNSEQSISTICRENMLHGQIIRSQIARGKVTSITIPPLSDDFLLISSHEIPGSNSISVHDTTMPLLSSERIHYRGEPVMALFGPDREAVSMTAAQIAVGYESEESETNIDDQQNVLEVSWGKAEELIEMSSEIVEYTYMNHSEDSGSQHPTGAFAELDDSGTVIITTATQWPFHVRNTVSEVCGRAKRGVIVHQLDYEPTVGQTLIYPSLYAALAAVAAVRTKKPCRIIDDFPTSRPEMIITRKTALNHQRYPIAETVEVQVNQGCYPLFSSEIREQTLAGITPTYALEAFSARIHTASPPVMPRHYFEGLGFSHSLFTSEAHAANLAMYAGINPVNWKMLAIRENPERPSHIIQPKVIQSKELLEAVVQSSDFLRKYAVYEMQKKRSRNISTFTGYARGIGIAAGQGINGFSRLFQYERNYSVSVTLEVNDHLDITTSFLPAETAGLWKQTAEGILGVPAQQISIAQAETLAQDSGPEILYRDSTVINLLISRCCESIKNQRFKEPLPITVKRSLRRTADCDRETQKKPLFDYLSTSALALELEIDPVTLIPRILGIWAAVQCGSLHDKASLHGKILGEVRKELSFLTGSEYQAAHFPDMELSFFSPVGNYSNPLPGIRGLLLASYTAALTQALNTPFTSIPAGPQEILEALGGRH